MTSTSSPAFRSMPRIRVSIASEALRDDRHLLGVAAELRGQVPPHRLDPRLEHVPHVVHRHLVGEAQVADHRLEHVGGSRAAPAVVQVDERAVGVEGALDLRPVSLVAGQVRRRAAIPPRREACATIESVSARKMAKARAARAPPRRPEKPEKRSVRRSRLQLDAFALYLRTRATSSISIGAFFGSAATMTVERAGLCPPSVARRRRSAPRSPRPSSGRPSS